MKRQPVVIRPEAAHEIRESKLWYEMQSSGLGTRFLDHLSEAIALIQTTPLIFPKQLKSIRACRVRRFPHIVYYRVLSDRIEILAVIHGSRENQHWQNRI